MYIIAEEEEGQEKKRFWRLRGFFFKQYFYTKNVKHKNSLFLKNKVKEIFRIMLQGVPNNMEIEF